MQARTYLGVVRDGVEVEEIPRVQLQHMTTNAQQDNETQTITMDTVTCRTLRKTW